MGLASCTPLALSVRASLTQRPSDLLLPNCLTLGRLFTSMKASISSSIKLKSMAHLPDRVIVKLK